MKAVNIEIQHMLDFKVINFFQVQRFVRGTMDLKPIINAAGR